MWDGSAAWRGASSSAWAPAASCVLAVGAIWGWRRGRACVAFCCAWCSVHWRRPCGGGKGSWAVLVVWVGVSALRLSAEWQGHDAGTTASSVAAASHTGSRGFQCHDSVPTNAHSSSPPSTSARQTDFSVARHFHATKRLALAIVPQHTGAPHTPTALNCLLCCCLLRTFLLVLLRHCILPEPFCTLQHATQTLHTHSNTFNCSVTVLRKKPPRVFLVTQLTSSL